MSQKPLKLLTTKAGNTIARLSTKPPQYLIDSLSEILDFSVWKGIHYVRKWPRYPKFTAAMKATHAALQNAINFWLELKPVDREAWNKAALHSNWTGRDMFFSQCMKKATPRGVFRLLNVVDIAGQLRIKFKVLNYAEPLLRFTWFDHDRISDFVTWIPVPYDSCVINMTEKIAPVFHYTDFTDGAYNINFIEFYIEKKTGFLFFYLDDPYHVTNYTTGTYTKCFT